MDKDEIRLQYSGFIVFAAQMLSVATGLAFTLLLTRSMTKQEYGIWANVFDVLGYFLLLSTVFPFWTMRFVARQRQGAARTGLLANLIVSLISASIYVSLTPFLTAAFKISGAYVIVYVVASVQIVNTYLILALEAILRAKKPQANGYGLLLEESCKIVLAFLLIVWLQQFLLGALLSIVLSTAVQVLYYLKLTLKDLRQRLQWGFAREWLKGSTVNIYNAVGSQLAASTIILLFLYGGQTARGNYQAAATYANIVGYALFLSYALYPKLLGRNSPAYVTSTLKTVLMFAIPMATVVLSLPRSLLTILNVQYTEATTVLLLLAADAFVVLISQFYSSVVFGVETLDEEATIPFKKLVGSKIFKVFSLPYIQAAFSIPVCFYVLTELAVGHPVLAAVSVAAISLASHTATLFIQYGMMRSSVRFGVPWRSICKYVFASAISAVFFYVFSATSTILLTVVVVLSGAAIYVSALLSIDRDARDLMRSILHEIKGILPHTQENKRPIQSAT